MTIDAAAPRHKKGGHTEGSFLEKRMTNEGLIGLHQPGLGPSPKMPHQLEDKSFTPPRSQ